MVGSFASYVAILDYIIGAAMWTLIGRFGMAIFVSENSYFFFMLALVKVTDPMIKALSRLTPSFLIDWLRPLYVTWFLFMIRFYVMPALLSCCVMAMLSFPLESAIAVVIYDLGQIFNYSPNRNRHDYESRLIRKLKSPATSLVGTAIVGPKCRVAAVMKFCLLV